MTIYFKRKDDNSLSSGICNYTSSEKMKAKVEILYNWLLHNKATNVIIEDPNRAFFNSIYMFCLSNNLDQNHALKITASAHNGKNILVLTERLELMNYIYEKLSKYTNNIFKYYGGIGKKVLKSYMELNNQINENEDNKIIVATGSYIGEGFDDSKLDVLFLTMPISGQTRVTQYAGRLHRQDSNKKEILIYDYIDDNFSKTRNMFLKRKKTYEKLGYEIVEEN